MVVALVTGNIDTLSTVRGIGSYTQNLKAELKKAKAPFVIDFVEKVTDSKKFNLIHYPYFDFFFHTLPIRAKTKRIVTIHDVIPLLFPDKFPAGVRGYLNLFLQKRALANVDFIICDSKASKRDIVDKLSVDENKVEVIYLAAGAAFTKLSNPKLLSGVKSKYNLPDKFCLYVGDVNWNKNTSGLLHAVANCKVPIVMVGKALTDSSLIQTKEIDTLIKSLGIQKLVTKTGYIPEPELVAVYNLADVTVSPSFYEGFGLPVLESMACGTPVICSDNSSLAEIGESAAIFCDPSDPVDIAKKIKEVIDASSTQREQLSKKSINHAQKYSYSKTARQTIDLYQKALK